MRELLAGIHHFERHVFHEQRELFEELVHGQSPQALFITCSDSRVNPNLLTQTDPGELFILRNVGNIVPPYSPATAGGSAAAAIEYAITGLSCKYVVLCGHSLCGAMKGLLEPQGAREMPSVAAWLRYAEGTRRIVAENYASLPLEERLDVAVQENVLVQLEHLRTYPCVAARLARGELSLYGWVYRIETGQVFGYHPELGQFVPVSERPPVPACPNSRVLTYRFV